MKIAPFTFCLLLAATAAPVTVMAQATTPPAIVVAGKYLGDWQKGSRLEAQGLKSLEQARADLVNASAAVVKAQDKTTSSQARSENASTEFRRLTASTPSFDNGRDALRWARQVEKAADNWARFANRHGDGQDALDKAMKDKAKAEKAVEKAQGTVDRGREMMADAERRSAP